VPRADGGEIVLSLGRMNRVRAIDLDNNTITVEAGCILAQLQRAAEAAERLFPLSLAAEGSCQIGGNLATNAGGTAVLRYGNARELTLGLEVVLPDGRIWNGLRGLRKDNTGYDLKQLFIGAEGTLGIITAAVLKLFARPKMIATALIALEHPRAAAALLNLVRTAWGDRLTGFELMSRLCLDFTFKHIASTHDPLRSRYPWYVLLEASETSVHADLNAVVESALAEALENGIALEAAIAQSEAQRHAFWSLRENLSEAQRHEGASVKHDVSVPVSAVPEFIERADAALATLYPGIRIVAFGHMGDGNIHYNVTRPISEDDPSFVAKTATINRVVHDLVSALQGSISAEHGLGQMKRDEIARYKDPFELELMRLIKRALDPRDLMNPGKVVPRV
jgi:FAD/FMN-containing dehydrogenase